MRRVWRQLLLAGSSHASSPADAQRAQLTNALCLVGFALSLMMRPFLSEAADPTIRGINLATLLIFVGAYGLNARGRNLGAALLIALIVPLAMLAQLPAGGIDANSHFYLFPGALLPFLVFPAPATRIAIVTSLASAIVLVTITQMGHGQAKLMVLVDAPLPQFQINYVAIPAVVCMLGYYTWRLLSVGEAGVEVEQRRSDALLLDLFPRAIVRRLQRGERIRAQRHGDASVLFCRVIGLDPRATTSLESQLELLGALFEALDDLCAAHGVEKIKSFGDSYMAASGLPEWRTDHAEALASAALEMLMVVAKLREERGCAIDLRIGIHSGPVVAGVIGVRRAAYDLWGDVVNLAQRMEANGITGAVQVSANTFAKINHRFACEVRPPIPIKGKLPERAYLIQGVLSPEEVEA